MQSLLHIIAVILVGASVYGASSSNKPDNFVVSALGGTDNLSILFIVTVAVVLIDLSYSKIRALNGSSDETE